MTTATYTTDRISIHFDNQRKANWILNFRIGDSLYHIRLRGAMNFDEALEMATEKIGRELEWELGENRWSGHTTAVARDIDLDADAIQRMTYTD